MKTIKMFLFIEEWIKGLKVHFPGLGAYLLGGYDGGGGYTHIFGQTGMCRSNGSLFYKKFLNMGPVFYQNILKHGSTFLTEPKFSGFRMVKTPDREIFEKWAYFLEKSFKMGTLFCQNHP